MQNQNQNRKWYLDNIRWSAIVLVVIYHVFYMYNAEGILGGAGKITRLPVQRFDVYLYAVYPWIMMVLFLVSGICARYDLERHSAREFARNRTAKLLVPSTIGLFVFQFLQGYVSMELSHAFDTMQTVPAPVKYVIMAISGIGVLWYIQVLWVLSMILILLRKIERDRLWKAGGKATVLILVLLTFLVWGAGQILNTPVIVVYRFGLYGIIFFLGYFVCSHDEVITVLKKWCLLFSGAAVVLGIVFCAVNFGKNYADAPVNRSLLFLAFGWFACLAILGTAARYADKEYPVTRWMNRRSFGIYVFHYLGISSVALFIGQRQLLPAPAVYLLSLAAGFAAGILIYAVLSRIPFFRWAVLGIRRMPANKK